MPLDLWRSFADLPPKPSRDGPLHRLYGARKLRQAARLSARMVFEQSIKGCSMGRC